MHDLHKRLIELFKGKTLTDYSISSKDFPLISEGYKTIFKKTFNPNCNGQLKNAYRSLYKYIKKLYEDA